MVPVRPSARSAGGASAARPIPTRGCRGAGGRRRWRRPRGHGRRVRVGARGLAAGGGDAAAEGGVRGAHRPAVIGRSVEFVPAWPRSVLVNAMTGPPPTRRRASRAPASGPRVPTVQAHLPRVREAAELDGATPPVRTTEARDPRPPSSSWPSLQQRTPWPRIGWTDRVVTAALGRLLPTLGRLRMLVTPSRALFVWHHDIRVGRRPCRSDDSGNHEH